MTSSDSVGTFLIKILVKNRLILEQVELEIFQDTLIKLESWQSTKHNPELLEELFYALDDNTEHFPSMQKCVDYIQEHEPILLAHTLLKDAHKHTERASYWIQQILTRFLMTSTKQDILKRKYQNLPDDMKPTIETLLWDIVRKDKWVEEDEKLRQEYETGVKYVLGIEKLPHDIHWRDNLK